MLKKIKKGRSRRIRSAARKKTTRGRLNPGTRFTGAHGSRRRVREGDPSYGTTTSTTTTSTTTTTTTTTL